MEQTTNKRIKITFCGIKFTFPNIFACTNNCIVLEKDNKIKVIKHVRGLKIKFYGSNNIIKFVDKIPSFKNVKIDCGNNTRICINATKHKIKNLYINARSSNTNINIKLKGAKVPNNSVIAKGSIFTKPYEIGNAIFAGAPAKIVKTDINWSRLACNSFYNDSK